MKIIVLSLIVALKKHKEAPVKVLAYEAGTEESNVREWLYEMEKLQLVSRISKTQKGKSSGRSTYWWSLNV